MEKIRNSEQTRGKLTGEKEHAHLLPAQPARPTVLKALLRARRLLKKPGHMSRKG